tara:strand:+ start:313 stop:525 length:213 start_codon:yes stop_codon:yes gene_type:complete
MNEDKMTDGIKGISNEKLVKTMYKNPMRTMYKIVISIAAIILPILPVISPVSPHWLGKGAKKPTCTALGK